MKRVAKKTVPLTLVMFDPKRTMKMIYWIMKAAFHVSLVEFLDGQMEKWDLDYSQIFADGLFPSNLYRITKEMFEAFPSLEKAVQGYLQIEPSGAYCGPDLVAAYTLDVLEQFTSLKDMNLFPIRLVPQQYYGNVYLAGGCFLFAAWSGRDAVMSRFSPELQSQIATWEFHLPKKMLKKVNKKFWGGYVGLHLEKEHQEWRRQYPSAVSSSVAAGLGAIYDVPYENYTVFNRSLRKKEEPFRLVFESIRFGE